MEKDRKHSSTTTNSLLFKGGCKLKKKVSVCALSVEGESCARAAVSACGYREVKVLLSFATTHPGWPQGHLQGNRELGHIWSGRETQGWLKRQNNVNTEYEGRNVQQKWHPKNCGLEWVVCLSHQSNLALQQSEPKKVSFIVSMMLTHLKAIPPFRLFYFEA